MIIITRRIAPRPTHQFELVLPFDLRQKSRLRTRLASGEEVGLFLDRGEVLRGGDFLESDDGRTVKVVAQPEKVLHIKCSSAQALARVAYHLGNRHVPLQVGDGWLRVADDHVLEPMLKGLGATLEHLEMAFEPEAGAYGAGHQHASPAAHRGIIHRFDAGREVRRT